MAINFPNSPTAGDPHSEAGIDWVYDGEKWVAQSEATFWARTSSTLSPSTAGDNISTTGDLTAGCTTTGTSGSSGEAKVVGYQQGIWTPTSPGVTSYVNGTFSRIGNQVTAHFIVIFGAVSGTSTVTVGGMPYDRIRDALDNNLDLLYRDGGTVAYTSYNGALSILMRASNATDFEFRKMSTANERLNWNDIANETIVGAISYLTDDTTWTPNAGATIS